MTKLIKLEHSTKWNTNSTEDASHIIKHNIANIMQKLEDVIRIDRQEIKENLIHKLELYGIFQNKKRIKTYYKHPKINDKYTIYQKVQ